MFDTGRTAVTGLRVAALAVLAEEDSLPTELIAAATSLPLSTYEENPSYAYLPVLSGSFLSEQSRYSPLTLNPER